ncbi:MAG TPA: DUF2911 domain-containing protein [Longimicrobiaceae bacterium]
MNRIAISLAAVIACAAPAAAQQQPQPQPVRAAASTFATVEVHLNQRPIGNQWYEEDAALTGPARIAISYGQPHARGRQVEGRLIPRDTVWRFGANAATTLHTDVDLNLGGLRVPRGDYSLFLILSGGVWRLIVNGATGQWGTDYDARRDVGRVALQARALAEPEESLTIYLVPESARPGTGYAETKGVLRIKWGRTELSTGWSLYR